MSEAATNNALQYLTAQMQRSCGYQARAEIERLLEPIRRDPKRLEPFGFKVYSQTDEDGMLEEIFRRIGVETGRFVEIGVEDGLECNTLYLLHKGWIGAWVEGDARRRPQIEQKFGSLFATGRLRLASGYISAENMAPVFAQIGVDDSLDFLSIDIDGNDVYLLEAMPVRPKVLCIEYNAKFRGNLDKQPVYNPNYRWSGSDYMGSSLKAVTRVANAKGYRLVGTNLTGGNAFFVREDLAGDAFPDDSSSEALYNPPRYWLWFDHYLRIGHRADFGPYMDLIGPPKIG